MYRYRILVVFFLCGLSQQMFCSQDRALRIADGENVDSVYNLQTDVSIFIEQCNFLPQLQNVYNSLCEISERADREGYHWELGCLSDEQLEACIKEPIDLAKPLFVLCSQVDPYAMMELMIPVATACMVDYFIEKIGS